jgi:hypothetical protein
MPNCGGAYGSYIGEINTGGYNEEAYSNAANANDDAGYGIGSSDYYMVEGPSPDHLTAAEALAWGEEQGNTAISNFVAFYDKSSVLETGTPIIWADLEDAGGGWSSNTSLNRDVYNGFHDAVAGSGTTIKGAPTDLWVGVYATDDWWANHMAGTLSGAFEWTAQISYSSWASGDCAHAWQSPDGSADHYAVFYASYSQSSACAVAWQWISGYNDYDQMYSSRIQNGMAGTCN